MGKVPSGDSKTAFTPFFVLYECQREFITCSGGIFFFGEKKRGVCVFVGVLQEVP
jgi:hypothetical protein